MTQKELLRINKELRLEVVEINPDGSRSSWTVNCTPLRALYELTRISVKGNRVVCFNSERRKEFSLNVVFKDGGDFTQNDTTFYDRAKEYGEKFEEGKL